MSARFVLQPNGLLAFFSSIVDNFTYINLSKQEAIEIAREVMGQREAEEKVERGMKDEIPWRIGVYGDGTARWKDCLKTIEVVHGKRAVEKVEAEIVAGEAEMAAAARRGS